MIKRLILLFLFFRLTDALGQSPNFQQYILLKKNDPVMVEVIVRDRAGFMWFGTNKGLFRFDGINTRRFTAADSLAIDHVTALAEDSTGRLWIGHKNGQLSVMENEVISKMNFREGDATEEISDILFATDGTMWFSTRNDGLYYYNERLYRLDEADGMPDIFVYDLEEAEDGTVWAGTDRGVAVCTLNDRKASIKVLDYKSGFPDNIIKKIARDDGKMWLATEDAGVFSYTLATGKSEPLTKSRWLQEGVNDFLKLGDEFWIATTNAGILAYDQSDDRLSIHSPVISSTLYVDLEGSVWHGSRNGVYRSRGHDIRFIESRGVTAITVDSKNNIWFATDEGLFKRGAEMQKVLANQYRVISLFTDTKGFVWAGFYGQGAARINPDNNDIKFFNKQLGNGNVLSISGAGNKVWLSTLNGATMIDIDKGFVITNYDRSQGLECDYVYQVFVDSKLRTWFASDREGVAMLDDTGFHKMLGSLTAKAVYGFAEDATGTIWANVQDDGLYKFDGKQFEPGTILRNMNINCLSSDLSGNLVAVHELGMDVYNPLTSTVHHLDSKIGFGDRQPSLNATAHDSHGKLYFGTDQGIVVYGESTQAEAKPVTKIGKVRVFNRYMDTSKELKLAYDENNVTINFHGFWYQDPHGVVFQYKLENYDVDWISTADHSAIFSSLQPGSYTFKVRASANGSFEGASEDSLSFVIKPPFWRTAAFYVIVAVTLAFATYTYFHRREKKLMRDKLELEEKVAERTTEILKKNEEILAQAEEIKAINESLEKRVVERTFELERKNKALEDYAFINAHKLRSPVASILGLVNLFSHVKDEKESKELIEHVKVSAVRLDEVVRTITESIEQGDQFESFKNNDEGVD